ncbi:MAG: indole-3-glycerol phosphate synthase TrpC [Thermogutta sp.]|nr:indole-3-glycerol phosphate synthase TrpC [Thermogutta sp.]HPU07265.1 indole-3-glycerol phosphate synthase TrpC [Thermogutta sp.]
MASILDRIVATKREEVERAKIFAPEEHLRRMVEQQPPPRDFLGAIRNAPNIALIAEVKKASPSKGVIRENFDPVAIARIYEKHGATCISVLTDEPYFQGHIEFLRWVKESVQIPVLRKDFILDSYQVLEARAYGADAVLLIAECLTTEQLTRLYHEILAWGMTPLVEVYEPENLPRVIDLGASLIGINNRNLQTFEVDLEHTIRLRAKIPSDRLVVGESGIQTHEDVDRLRRAGVNAILVGESLMREADIGLAVDRLLGKS